MREKGDVSMTAPSHKEAREIIVDPFDLLLIDSLERIVREGDADRETEETLHPGISRSSP